MERQLLFLLDFDLRFDEAEACVLFAPFMGVRSHSVPAPMSPEQQETRTAAVNRVSKAGKARAQAQLPPTPPKDAGSLVSSSSTLASVVRCLAKRISNGAIGTSLSNSMIDVQIRSPPVGTGSLLSNSSRSTSALSVKSSDMDSLIYDSGSSSDSDSESLAEHEDSMEIDLPCYNKKFTLRPVPAYAYRRQGRKVSETASVNSTSTVRANGVNSFDSSPLEVPGRRVAFEEPSYISGGRTGRRSSTHYVAGDRYEDVTSELSHGVSRLKESHSLSSHGSGSFLSRMWTAATKTQDKVDVNGVCMPGNGKLTTSIVPPSMVGIVEPKESYPNGHGASAFRRLVHSRSGVFRHGDVP